MSAAAVTAKPIPPTQKKPYGAMCGACITVMTVGQWPARTVACRNDKCAQQGVPFSV